MQDPSAPRLLDLMRWAIRTRHYSRRTETAYVRWIVRFIVYHGKKHPGEMGESKIADFLSSLAVRDRVAAATQAQALSALLFLYRHVLRRELSWIEGIVRAKAPKKLPVVLSRDEVRAVLSQLNGVHRLVATLLYGAGLRLMECIRLRVKDLDFARNQIVVRVGKGGNDRLTMLPAGIKTDLRCHLERIGLQHDRDVRRGEGWVELPGAIARKYPNAGQDWGWQWVFPATRQYRDPTRRARCPQSG